MPIADKTRKILWGRSGNRCAFCRHELLIAASSRDDESIVGDECHIVSGRPQGPRYDPEYPAEKLDDPSNLILLCRVHHKMVDDQHQKFSVQKLQSLRSKHEEWVSAHLDDEPQVRVRRIQENVPQHLLRLRTGRDVIAIVENACAGSFDHDDPESPEEVELFSGFLQELQDWADLSSDLEAGDRVRAVFRLNALLQQLEQAGFWVFGAREVQCLDGGKLGSSAWPVSLIRIVRASDPSIIKLEIPQGTTAVSP
ncbi:MAG: HNH endonuclease [Planctomycetia bacterium]|nr:HNH endonuclease [Planctomycetia bacterium]